MKITKAPLPLLGFFAGFLFQAKPVGAVTLNLQTSSSPVQTFFSNTESAVDVFFEGTTVLDSIEITEGIPINGAFINLLKVTTRNPALGGLSERQPISYTLTINDPTPSGPTTSVTVTYDLTVSVTNGVSHPVVFAYNLTSPFPPTTTFNLGAQGLLDVTFVTPGLSAFPPNDEGSSGQYLTANFFVRSASVSEPNFILGAISIGILGTFWKIKKQC